MAPLIKHLFAALLLTLSVMVGINLVQTARYHTVPIIVLGLVLSTVVFITCLVYLFLY